MEKTNKKTNKQQKYNFKNHKSIVFVVGGTDTIQSFNTIYYGFGDYLNDEYQSQNIWRKSMIELPLRISQCQCMILKKESHNPTLVIIGGCSLKSLNNHWEFQMCDILDNQTYSRFVLDFQRVIYA